MTLGGRALTLAGFSVALLLFAASAQATVVTLGMPTFPPSEKIIACDNNGCGGTVAQVHPASSNTAPAAGVITSWAASGQNLALRVLEPAPGGGWRDGPVSAHATDVEGGPNATELSIPAGGLIGLDILDLSFSEIHWVEAPGAEVFEWRPPLGEDEARNPQFQEPAELELNAQVELTPVVTSVSPASGSTAGGNSVTITGKYLDSALNVVFGSRPATSFSVDLSGERITATAPASAAGPVDVHVSNFHSTSESVAADRYTFVSPSAPSGPPAGPSTPNGGGSGQTNTLVVTGFAESTGKWRLGGAPPHISRAPVGTTFAFDLNEAANVALTFTQVLPGRRAAGKCVAPSRGNRKRPKCTRHVVVAGLPVSGHAGLNTIRFQGRVSQTKKLSPGSYTVGVTSHDARGLKSLTRSLSFTILP